MSVIEEAARRLEELQRAGIKTPEPKAPESAPGPEGGKTTLVERAARAAKTNEEQRAASELQGKTARRGAAGDDGASPAPSSRRIELDLAHLAERGVVTPDVPRSRLADEFRVVKRPLLANAALEGDAAIKNGNLIIITSALPGEGKSFTAANLAMSMAMELDRTVLLVDADVARPSMPQLLGLPTDTRGLLDLLVDDSVQLADVLLRTNIEKLSILPSGTKHARATELLASEGMSRLLDDMAQRYADRIIVFDSPPLLVTTEARVLATYMGQVVMVIRADTTPQSVVRHALSTIESCPVKLMLLNQARGSTHGSYYGYGYGSGYGYGT